MRMYADCKVMHTEKTEERESTRAGGGLKGLLLLS